MKELNQLQKESAPTLSLDQILMTQKIKVIITEDFYKKIAFLCRKISEVEWSGILLYTYEGSLEQPQDFVITTQDIILMDKGSGGATNYSYNENGYDPYIDYREKYPERRHYRVGHIHSHNNMGVFFSGTDTDELKENSPSHLFYLSLIVNNKLDTCAKLTYCANIETQHIEKEVIAKNERDESFVVEKKTFIIRKNYLCIHDCEIEIPIIREEMESFFLQNVEEVLKRSDRASFTKYCHQRDNNIIYSRDYLENEKSFYTPDTKSFSSYKKNEEVSNNVVKIFNNSPKKSVEDFLKSFYGNKNLTRKILSDNFTLGGILQMINEADIDISFLENYTENFLVTEMCSFFNYHYIIDEKAICFRLKDCKKELKSYQYKFSYVKKIVEVIEKIIKLAK